MFGFAAIERDVAVSADAPAAIWELKLLSLDQIRAEARPSEAPATATPPAAPERGGAARNGVHG